MVSVSLVFWGKYISCQPNHSTFVYYHPLLETKTKTKKNKKNKKQKKTKNKKQKTKIASITLKPITVLDTTTYHNFGLVYFCWLRG